jgi:Uncharacterized conserved protein (DUF2303)
MSDPQKSDVTAIVDFVKKHLEPQVVTVETPDGGKCQVLVAPVGTEVTSIKELVAEYRTKPERIIGTARHSTLESFIDHAIRFSDEESALFAHRDPTRPQLLAVYDYHPAIPERADVSDGANRASVGVPRAAQEARFAQHRAIYDFPVSDEWKTWTGASGIKMGQAAFAEFLEDHIHDVADPLSALPTTMAIMESLLCKFVAPSGLMELARSLTVRVESTVVNATKLASGEATFRFDTKHTDESGAPLTVPGAFLISIPVFRGGDRYQLAARLRYVVANGKITWSMSLHRHQEALDFAVGLACEKAKEETKLPLFVGQPEA